ncbi:fluoride export protein 1 [Colletotrichum spaethianum]|uniref:Fluoride export protein 1 n=1 Tax=Colletotrichum spaethianum TaxID=700344 RepID=A0AA37P2Q1_9PEZI|nr:fluoride export protein 1 [Colletotrichum spaethianum]GKT46883.1 fluoride export protein 1 [Colletotrichum spaethianum]
MQNGDLRGDGLVANPGEGDNRFDGEPMNNNSKRRGTFGMPALKGSEESIDARHAGSVEYDVPEAYENLDETVADPVAHSPSESRTDKAPSLEGRRPSDIEMQDGRRDEQDGSAETPPRPVAHLSKLETELYTLSYLVFFAIFGTLARLGIQALTTYPGAPVSFGVLWANVGGSLVMGFLAEDRKLFKHEWGTATYHDQIHKARRQQHADGSAAVDLAAAKKAHLATKKTIPLYIGLATGFCGSFTSFSSFIRDVFLAMSNDLPGAGGAVPETRNGGYSFMAMLAVILTTVSLSLSALVAGAHLAAALEPVTPSIPYPLSRKFLDRGAVFLGWGSWLGAVLLAIFPPHDAWRGQAVFSLVFAPLGCLARFYASLWLNSRVPAFPVGTFTVNITGVAVLGMCWDLGHAGLGGVVGCQVLQGVEDGFCGCLTTVSTWVAELTALRRRHAYVYGVSSVVVGFAVLVVIMGAMRWTDGFGPLMCTH